MLPALRFEIRRQTNLADEEAHARLTSRPPLRHAAFHGYTSAAAPERMHFFELSHSVTKEVVGAHQSLRRLHGGDQTRDTVHALVALTHLLRQRATLPLCAQLHLSRHAVPLLAHGLPLVRKAALSLFVAIADLRSPCSLSIRSIIPGEDLLNAAGVVPLEQASAEEAAAADSLFSCFSQLATMHCLARFLHDSRETFKPRMLAVILMGRLLASEDEATLTAMGRTDVWAALAKLVAPCFVHGQKQKVDLGAKPIFEALIRRGTPAPLLALQTKPAILAILKDHGLGLPAPPKLERLAGAAAVAENGGPPPVGDTHAVAGRARALLSLSAPPPPEDVSEAATFRHAAACMRQLGHRSASEPLAELLRLGTKCAMRAYRTLAQRAEHDGALARLASGAREAHGILHGQGSPSDIGRNALAAEATCDAFLGLVHEVFLACGGAGKLEEVIFSSPAVGWVAATAMAATPLEAEAERQLSRSGIVKPTIG